MDALYEKSLKTIELPAVLEMLSREAVSDSAKELALMLTPSGDEAEVRHRLAETGAATYRNTVSPFLMPLPCFQSISSAWANAASTS